MTKIRVNYLLPYTFFNSLTESVFLSILDLEPVGRGHWLVVWRINIPEDGKTLDPFHPTRSTPSFVTLCSVPKPQEFQGQGRDGNETITRRFSVRGEDTLLL